MRPPAGEHGTGRQKLHGAHQRPWLGAGGAGFAGWLAQADSRMRTAMAQTRRIVFSRIGANKSASESLTLQLRAAHAEPALRALASAELHHLPSDLDGVLIALHAHVLIGAVNGSPPGWSRSSCPETGTGCPTGQCSGGYRWSQPAGTAPPRPPDRPQLTASAITA